MKTIHAIFEKGVFRPLEKVEMPDLTEVEFDPKIVSNGLPRTAEMGGIVRVMGCRFRSGQENLAERHDQHQP